MPTAPIEQTFWEHLGSLRNHLLVGAGFFGLVACAAFSIVDPLTHLLLLPLHGQQLVFLTVLGPFLFKMKVACLLALIISTPLWIGLLFHFVAPAMPARGRIAVASFVSTAGILAALALLVSYLYLVPTTLKVLLAMPVEGTSVVLTADSYLDFFFLETIVAFIIFQLPLIINLLAYLRMLDPRHLAGKRRILYVALLIVLAVATPTTDVFSLLVVFVPAVLFMEAGLAIARVVHTHRI
jgi:sec-independent protein translocase protein TatC